MPEPLMTPAYIRRVHQVYLRKKRRKNPPKGVLTYGDQLGSKNWCAKITEKQVLALRVAYAKGAKTQALAKRYSITAKQVTSIARGDAWKHVGGPITRRKIRA